MSTPEECNMIRINQAELTGRVGAMSERLDEVLQEVRDIKAWFSKYGTICFLFILLGDKAIPVITKILGITV